MVAESLLNKAAFHNSRNCFICFYEISIAIFIHNVDSRKHDVRSDIYSFIFCLFIIEITKICKQDSDEARSHKYNKGYFSKKSVL